ncbi:glycosyltransferase [Marinococcus halotolerans]|uniref:glycosyltransferase n=1 Tax=Marinococcus halotolerans TaxID=301092 RepID=UPI0003B6F546|nr:glycosyltransferase family 2 protein [Marinococcus halotolerans]
MKENKKHPKIAIVILNWNNGELTNKCVSYLKEIKYENKEIWVLDNGSTDNSLEFLRKLEDIYLITSEKNLGFAKGLNYGVGKAIDNGADYIWAINNDIIVEDKHILNKFLKHALRLENSFGVLGANIKLKDRTYDKISARRKWRLKDRFLTNTLFGVLLRKAPLFNKEFRKIYYNYFLDKPNNINLILVDVISGSALFFSEKSFRLINGFDENTFLYQEEYILSKRIEKFNLVSAIAFDCEVIHLHGQSTQKIGSFSYIEYIKSELYYLNEYTAHSNLTVNVWKIIRIFDAFLKEIIFHKLEKGTTKAILKYYY